METAKILYIHAGMGKAGSTSIQNMFHENREYFQEQGIYYPSTGKVNAHHDISTLFTYRRHMQDSKTENYINILKEEIDTVKPDNCLISSEHFFGVLDSHEVAEVIRSVFRNYNIKIIIYVRRADKKLPSNYKQQVLGLRYREFDKNYGRINYLEKLTGCKKVFDLKNSDIIIRPFEKGQFCENNLLKDILNIIGVEDPANISGNSKPANVKANVNLDVIEYARQMSASVKDLPLSEIAVWRKLFSGYPCQNEYEDVSLFGTYENLEDVMCFYAPIYETIAREYLNREDGQLFYEEPPPGKDDFRGYPGLTVEKIAQISGYLNYKIRSEYMTEIAEIKALKERHTLKAKVLNIVKIVIGGGFKTISLV